MFNRPVLPRYPVPLLAGPGDTLRRLHVRALGVAVEFGTSLPAAGFVFTDDPAGDAPWKPRTMAGRFKRVCAQAGRHPTTRLHDLRPLMATHAGRTPRSDEVAAEVMGRLLDGE